MGKEDDFHERFLKANANVDFIASKFADVVRELMRAISSDDPPANVYRAAEHMNFVAQLLSRTDEKFGFHQLFAKALEEFEDTSEWPSSEHAMLHAAKRGMKYLIENSCDDPAARGRTSQRSRDFLAAIGEIDESREARRTSR